MRILLLCLLPLAGFAQNPDCTLLVPARPLSAKGLATPYQLSATNPANGACDQRNFVSRSFVQGVVLDPESGRISVFNPLVINAGTVAGVMPTPPRLPEDAVVALYFGSNGNNLTLTFAQRPAEKEDHDKKDLLTHWAAKDDGKDNEDDNPNCVQGFGESAWCNAVNFFKAANRSIAEGRTHVPPLGISPADHLTCPSVRSFRMVDQDQSDNVTTKYVLLANGLFASNTAANRARPGATLIFNPSDNGLLDGFIDPALGCTPWLVPDLQDGGHLVPSLPTNELQAAVFQGAPVALVPLGDPFTFAPALTGVPDLARVNVYRANVDQPPGTAVSASTAVYCANFRTIQTNDLLIRDRLFLAGFPSPLPDVANSLFTFLATRYVVSYQILNCAVLLGKPVNVALTADAAGVTIDATVGLP